MHWLLVFDCFLCLTVYIERSVSIESKLLGSVGSSALAWSYMIILQQCLNYQMSNNGSFIKRNKTKQKKRFVVSKAQQCCSWLKREKAEVLVPEKEIVTLRHTKKAPHLGVMVTCPRTFGLPYSVRKKGSLGGTLYVWQFSQSKRVLSDRDRSKKGEGLVLCSCGRRRTFSGFPHSPHRHGWMNVAS